MTVESGAEVTVQVGVSANANAADIEEIFRLFDECYESANPTYLERSLAMLRNVATARQEDRLVGFCLGEMRNLDLPGLGAQSVALSGLCCVSPLRRRQGLSERLVSCALAHEAQLVGERFLAAARMAHPASSRRATGVDSVVPTHGRRPTQWQREVGSAVARAYGSVEFDPEHFVIRGSGTPVGYPRIDIDAEVVAAEADLFEHVDRGRGDVLLTIAWSPTAPAGWYGGNNDV